MNKMKYLLISLLAIVAMSAQAMPAHDKVDRESARQERNRLRSGNESYDEQDYAKSEEEYRRAIDANDNSDIAYYNLGNALYRQGDKLREDIVKRMEAEETMMQNMDSIYNEVDSIYGVALDNYNIVVNNTDDEGLKAKAYHNMGNSYMCMRKFPEAIDAYKEALRIDPMNDNTRINLRIAQKKLQQQQEQQQQQQEQQQQEEKKESPILNAMQQREQEALRQMQPQGQSGQVEKPW